MRNISIEEAHKFGRKSGIIFSKKERVVFICQKK